MRGHSEGTGECLGGERTVRVRVRVWQVRGHSVGMCADLAGER